MEIVSIYFPNDPYLYNRIKVVYVLNQLKINTQVAILQYYLIIKTMIISCNPFDQQDLPINFKVNIINQTKLYFI